jgi:AraC-like DNA-binding protein
MVLLSVNASFLIALKIPYQLTQLNLGTEAYENISLVEKYKNSTLSEEQKNEIELKLNELVVLEKYYRTSNLTIHELSQRINIQSKFISQVINELYSQNFCEYINAIRIDEAKSILRDNNFAHKTILEVCYEVGFNSKSTFNAVFKKQTGCTPSKYRNSYFPRSR